MKQYLLSVYIDENSTEPAGKAQEDAYRDVDALNKEIQAKGAWVFAGGLHPTSSSTVVRVRDGEVLTVDGPFLETKEHLGGFWVISAENLDEALEWARRGTEACGAPVEVRPFQEDPGA